MAFNARRFLEAYAEAVWTRGDLSVLDQFLAPNYRSRVSAAEPPISRDKQRDLLASFRGAFPEVELAICDVLLDGVDFRGVGDDGDAGTGEGGQKAEARKSDVGVQNGHHAGLLTGRQVDVKRQGR